MLNRSIYRASGMVWIAALVLGGCTQLSGDQGPQPTTTATTYADFGPRQPGSGFGTTNSVIADAGTGVFGTTDAISIDDGGPFPPAGSFDPTLSDLSADDQALLAGTGIDLAGDAALASTLTFPGDDGSEAFFDADIGATVFFATDSSSLSDGARETLRSQAAWLSVHPEVTATVGGHTDERGTREYNIALGERRASTVRGYLTALGVDGSRVRKVSYGKERPAVPGSDEAAWSRNRRAETTLSRESLIGILSGGDPTLPGPRSAETSVDSLLNDPVLNDLPAGDPLFDDPLLNDPLLNDI